MKVKLLIVDDDKLIRDSLSMYAKYDDEIDVVGVCANGDEAFKMCMTERIDVVLMDIRMPICDGVLGTKKIKEAFPDVKILILTTFDDDEYIFAALKNGASGYILKDISPERILENIKIVNEGSLIIHQNIASKIVNFMDRDTTICDIKQEYKLNEIEIKIIEYIAEGFTNKEISKEIHLSEGTIKNYITGILNKLNLRDRTQIAVFYYKNKQKRL